MLDRYGDPVAEAEVWLENMSAIEGATAAVWLGSDADGNFNAPRARAGLYTVTASARGFRPQAVAVELDSDVGDLRIALAPAPSPRAIVLDPEGRPVADAFVVACSQTSEVTLRSAADGTVAFGSGASGCSARAHHARFAHSSSTRLRGEELTVLRLERGGTIEGVATDLNGRGLYDADVSVSAFEPSENELPLAGSLPELHSPLGRGFRFAGLAPGTYTLTVFRHIRVEDTESTEELAAASYEVVAGHAVRGVHIVAEANEAPPSAPIVVPIVVPRLPPILRVPTLRELVPPPAEEADVTLSEAPEIVDAAVPAPPLVELGS